MLGSLLTGQSAGDNLTVLMCSPDAEERQLAAVKQSPSVGESVDGAEFSSSPSSQQSAKESVDSSVDNKTKQPPPQRAGTDTKDMGARTTSSVSSSVQQQQQHSSSAARNSTGKPTPNASSDISIKPLLKGKE